MGNHHRLGLLGQSLLQTANINVVLGHGHIHKNRHSPILQSRRYRGGEATGYGNNFISPLNLPLSKLRRG